MPAGVVRVIPTSIILFDGEGCSLCATGKEGREPIQIGMAWELIVEVDNCKPVLVNCGRHIFRRLVHLLKQPRPDPTVAA